MKQKYSIVLMVITSLLIVTCQKEDSPNNAAINFKMAQGNQNCLYIYPSDDNGVFVLYSVNAGMNNKINITKIKSDGNTEWTRLLLDAESFQSISPSNDGGVFMISNSQSPRLIKLNNKGDEVINKEIPPQFYKPPIEGANKHIFISLNKDIIGSWFTSDSTKILEFDQNGEQIKENTLKVYDHSFLPKGGKVGLTDFSIFKVEGNQTFYMWGYKYNDYGFPILFDGSDIFFARLEYSNNKLIQKETIMLDSNSVFSSKFTGNGLQLLSKDNRLVFSCSQELPNGDYRSFITMIDENFKAVWKMNISFGLGYTFINSLTNGPEGDFLICGDCRVSGKGNNQPFAAKISKTGEILWHKIYNTSLYGRFTHGVQTNNGSIFLGGNSTAFGRGLTSQDFFLIRTDKDGILK